MRIISAVVALVAGVAFCGVFLIEAHTFRYTQPAFAIACSIGAGASFLSAAILFASAYGALGIRSLFHVIAVLLIGTGVGLFYFGQSTLPPFDPEKMNVAEWAKNFDSLTVRAGAFRAAGAGCFTVGTLGLVVSFLNRLRFFSRQETAEAVASPKPPKS